jgi:hypothetical protein
VSRFTTLTHMRRVALLAVAVAGLGLFGTGVRGLTQVDEQLATAADSQAPALNVKQELDVRRDCPWQDDQRQL